MKHYGLLLKPPIFLMNKRTIASVIQGFRQSSIVPDVLHRAPEELLEVDFNYNPLSFGSTVTSKFVTDEPMVTWKFPDPSKKYTLCMVNPDSPTRANPVNREWLHWLVVNIPGDLIERGDTIAEYIGASSDETTGIRRYVFLVFLQSMNIDARKLRYISADMTSGRSCFSTLGFQNRYQLSAPIAGNYFYSKCEVPLAVQFSRIRERAHRPKVDRTPSVWVSLNPAYVSKD